MKLTLGLLLLAVSGCLHGCSMKLDSPAEAFGVGSQKDRTAKVSRTWFGAKAEVPLTDLSGKGWLVTYDKASNSFTLKMDEFDQNWSSTMTVENQRIAENKELYLALTTAQQEIYLQQIAAQKEVAGKLIDGAAQAIGLLAKTPGGSDMASGLIGKLLETVGPDLIPTVMEALTKNGVALTP